MTWCYLCGQGTGNRPSLCFTAADIGGVIGACGGMHSMLLNHHQWKPPPAWVDQSRNGYSHFTAGVQHPNCWKK